MVERNLLLSQEPLQQAGDLRGVLPAPPLYYENPCGSLWVGKWSKVSSNSLVNVGVGVVGKNVVLSAEDLHGLLGVFLQLKCN